MSDAIFLLQGEGELVELASQQYDSEDVLQRLLAQYPNLIPGISRWEEKKYRALGVEKGPGVWARRPAQR